MQLFSYSLLAFHPGDQRWEHYAGACTAGEQEIDGELCEPAVVALMIARDDLHRVFPLTDGWLHRGVRICPIPSTLSEHAATGNDALVELARMNAEVARLSERADIAINERTLALYDLSDAELLLNQSGIPHRSPVWDLIDGRISADELARRATDRMDGTIRNY